MIYLIKPGHYKKDCTEMEDTEDFVQIIVSSDEDCYESVGALVL